MVSSIYAVAVWLASVAVFAWFLWLVFREPPSNKRSTKPDTTSSYKGPEPLWRMRRRKNPRLRRRRKNGEAQKKVQA